MPTKFYHHKYACKYNDGSLDRGKPVPQANDFAHFFGEGHQVAFSVSVKIIDGAHNVFSVRCKELFWQCKNGTFIPNGLNDAYCNPQVTRLCNQQVTITGRPGYDCC